jgi:hypothetical protein
LRGSADDLINQQVIVDSILRSTPEERDGIVPFFEVVEDVCSGIIRDGNANERVHSRKNRQRIERKFL